MKIFTFTASKIAKLDSDVYNGGGTDDTKAIQEVLDMADENTGIRLIMDGAALVSTLYLSSNTTVECLGKACGFFQAPNVNGPILTNKDRNLEKINTKNIEIKGGTYNQDCRTKEHHVMATEEEKKFTLSPWRCVFALEFYGVENLYMSGVTVVDFRTYAFMLGNFKNCTIENSWLELPHHMGGNQDGFHFWGPGQFLTVKNVGGRVGDDFMNIGPDEGDGVSSITDVLVDGVFLDEADQAIRLLSRGTGLLDRVTVRNVHGTYKSFGFFIDPWYRDSFGNFGDMLFENIDLQQQKPNYTYHNPILFSVGGDIKCLTLKNIRHINPTDNRTVIELGVHVPEESPENNRDMKNPEGKKLRLDNFILDGLTVTENESSEGMNVMEVYGEVGNLIVRNVLDVKNKGVKTSGTFIKLHDGSHTDNLIISGACIQGTEKIVEGEENAEKVTVLM